MSNVAKVILKLVAEKAGGDRRALVLSDPLDELGFDSLKVVELIFDIEERFDIEIPINANYDISAKTLADLIGSVEGLVSAKAGAA
jgi:acyl carrier protein